MTTFNNAQLDHLPSGVAAPAYDRAQVRPGIVHFGVGNFFRAHLAHYVDALLNKGGHDAWGIVGVGLRDSASGRKKATDFAAQQGLYSLTAIAPDEARSVRAMGPMVDYIHAAPGAQREHILDLLAAPETKIVSLTITEGGYNIDEASGRFKLDNPAVARDLAHPTEPETVFGYVVEGLARRRAKGLGGLTIMSCDNLRQNGKVSHTAFTSYARARDAGLADWMESHVTFPNAMVDRIAPTVTAERAAALNKASGLEDRQPVLTEAFTQWVVEDRFAAGRPDFAAVGAQFSDDVPAFEHAKIRVLNESHLMLATAGMLMGLTYVDEAMRQKALLAFVKAVQECDVLPTLKAPPGVNLVDYMNTILERFSNKAMMDSLARIASDATSKAQVFWTETVLNALAGKTETNRVAYMLALLLEYLRGQRTDGSRYELQEPALSPEQLKIAASDDWRAALALPAFDPFRSKMTPAFEKQIVEHRKAIRAKGVPATLPH
ncbi:mannitol dehydrogenase family protein [Formicincola oecophyllae]|uniref:Mannitol dehydrogenase family protein n=1 Tax=Formicincola oecophyllae TaxID=2558361 RepID=A0A4Y6UB20_9PROT|nr:mannitol dehydrogenase family protein [Formicincola oecophyllae]QDH13591.1 mannitol dehydrogenase family protein [Formicincola oecophyllae]